MVPIVHLCRIAIPTVTVAELMVEKPARNPVWTILAGDGQAPVVTCPWIARQGNALHGLVLGPLQNIRPVIGWLPLAILLQMALL